MNNYVGIIENRDSLKLLSRVWLFVTPGTIACQTPLSMEFSRQEYRSALPCPPQGHLPNPRIEPRSPTLQRSQKTEENSLRDGNTRSPSLPPEKPARGSRSNSYNQTWNNKLVQNWERSTSRPYTVTLLIHLICRVYCVKCQAGWITSWNKDCQKKNQQPQICRWYHPNGRKWRGTEKRLDESERGEWKTVA